MNKNIKVEEIILLLKNLQYYLLTDYSDPNVDDGTRAGIDQLIVMTDYYIRELSK